MNERPGRILRLPEVLHRCGISKSSLYRMKDVGLFPPSVPIGERAVGWYERDIDQWVDTRRATE